jgi:hypothetical protein
MDKFSDTYTGAACAMVVANSAARAHRDVRSASLAREPDDDLADRALEVAVQGRDAETVARLAAAVVSPIEPKAPLLERVRARVGSDEGATKILDDHAA